MINNFKSRWAPVALTAQMLSDRQLDDIHGGIAITSDDRRLVVSGTSHFTDVMIESVKNGQPTGRLLGTSGND